MKDFLKRLRGSLSLREATGIVLVSNTAAYGSSHGQPLWISMIYGLLFGLMWFYLVKES